MYPLREMQSLNNAVVCSLTNIPNFQSENQELLASRLSSVMELSIPEDRNLYTVKHFQTQRTDFIADSKKVDSLEVMSRTIGH